MKNKILILALFGLFFGARMFAQCIPNRCAPDVGIYFPSSITNTFYVTIENTCAPGIPSCTYYINPPGGCMCIDGATNDDGEPGCAPLADSAFSHMNPNPSPEVPCYLVVIKNYNSTLIDSWWAYWDGTAMNYTFAGGVADHHFHYGGVLYPDFFLHYDAATGEWLIGLWSFSPTYDDEGTLIAM